MYELGCFVAFILWLYRTVILLVAINSTAERNLRKVGMRHSWYTGSVVVMTYSAEYKHLLASVIKFAAIRLMFLVGIIFSWISVVWFFGSLIYLKGKDSGAPAEVKEFRWKLRNRDLSFDDLVTGLAKISGVDAPLEVLRNDMFENMRERGFNVSPMFSHLK
ncbi:hypothetical protein [Massilia sp. LC238]|uniref:hypothetical protein n=1 Tax=Massilia sp. LC238 TaxID=1502852 RepID=UPI00055D196B|nr:hypothetical protein [Massilia sp. LC238]